ncbi:MAG: glycerol-3-phosphate dehydrogenase/oxidase [Actinomycetales bacterium]|nr:glycerol-3-phosphate dehydrogenase/oxidase [Actinomycetales bacterium]
MGRRDGLGPAERRRALERLRASSGRPLDVLVVGGGVVGAGSALDAAHRGLEVGLIERTDLAAGTSSRSSRLAHGGLRYLEQGQFRLVHEALAERGLLAEVLAPHLVAPLDFILPLTHPLQRPYLGAGVALYETLSRLGGHALHTGRPRLLSGQRLAQLAPGLAVDQLAGALTFTDAQIDDARHTLAAARTAAGLGAAIVAGAALTGLVRRRGRVVGVHATIDDGTAEVTIHARTIVLALGPWTTAVLDRLLPSTTGAGVSAARVRRSRGSHILVPRHAIDLRTAVIARTPVSVLFLLPWRDHWIIGTTDLDDDGPLDDVRATTGEVAYLLDQANRWLTTPLTAADVVGSYAGIRPLIAATDADTTALSREHAIAVPAPGLVVVSGGKYTTYRVMAEDAVDAAVRELGFLGIRGIPASRTASLPLTGAVDFAATAQRRLGIAQRFGVAPEVVDHLLRRHGDRTEDVLSLTVADPSLAERLDPTARYLRAEVVHAAQQEGARSVADVLERRTRLAVETRDAGSSLADDVAALLAPTLGWDEDQVRAQARAYQERHSTAALV